MNCSFCGKNQDEVQTLIAGPDVYICDECITLCIRIINENREKDFIRKLHETAFREVYGTD